MIDLSKQDLLEYLRYNKAEGTFTWVKSPAYRVRVGDNAGGLRQDGCISINLKGTSIKVQNLVWFFEYNSFPPSKIFHKDGNTCNNKVENLTLVEGEVCYTSLTGRKAAITIKAEFTLDGITYTKSIEVTETRTEQVIMAGLTNWLNDMKKENL